MKQLNQYATRTFLKIVEQLEVGEGRCIDNASPYFMPVYVDRLSDRLYAVAHLSHRSEDLLPDPDVEFYVIDDLERAGQKAVYPTAIDQFHAIYQRMVDFDASGAPAAAVHPEQAGLASFCDTWMRNIAWQQGLDDGALPPLSEQPSMEGDETDA